VLSTSRLELVKHWMTEEIRILSAGHSSLTRKKRQWSIGLNADFRNVVVNWAELNIVQKDQDREPGKPCIEKRSKHEGECPGDAESGALECVGRWMLPQEITELGSLCLVLGHGFSHMSYLHWCGCPIPPKIVDWIEPSAMSTEPWSMYRGSTNLASLPHTMEYMSP
jgi:hypothetical protein